MYRQILNLAHQEKTINSALSRHAMTKQFEFAFIKRDLFKLTATFLCFLFSGLATAQDLQSWSVKIDDGAQRFQMLAAFNNEAVLDKETQLVWEREPNRDLLKWQDALNHCQNAVVGGRLGWRLPSISEVTSLADGSVTENENHVPIPAFSVHHPFILKFGPGFWSVDKSDPKSAWVFDASNGGMVYLQTLKNDRAIAWCVRSS
jgi:hypothetical protein